MQLLTQHPLSRQITPALPLSGPAALPRVDPITSSAAAKSQRAAVIPDAQEGPDEEATEPISWVILGIFVAISLFAFYTLWAKSVGM